MQRKRLRGAVFAAPVAARGSFPAICRQVKGLAGGRKETFDAPGASLLISSLKASGYRSDSTTRLPAASP